MVETLCKPTYNIVEVVIFVAPGECLKNDRDTLHLPWTDEAGSVPTALNASSITGNEDKEIKPQL
jgi:hypothetical protein